MIVRLTKRDVLRALASGRQAVALRRAAQELFEAGGKKLLPVAAQQMVRTAIEREASRLTLGVGGLLKEAAETSARALEAPVAATAPLRAPVARAAGRQMVRGIGRAAGVGALLDGAWGAAEAILRVRNRTMTPREGVVHVAKEASTGAAATAAGAAAAAALVTLTGGMAVPAVFAVGAATSVAAKISLSTWLDKQPFVARLATAS